MNKTETKTYLKTLNFGLKNLEKTEQKYKDYKTEEFNKLMNVLVLNSSNGFHLRDLSNKIFNGFIKANNINSFYKDLDYTKKTNIRMLKTYINGLTFNLNYEYLKDYREFKKNPLNANTNKNFNIMFYLKYYDRINKSMKDTLIKIVLLRVKQ